MFTKLRSIGLCVGVAGAVLLSSGGTRLMADTVTVQNLSQDTLTGVFDYAVTLDSETHLLPGDGFVLYDFPALTSWNLAGGGASGSINSSGNGITGIGPFQLVQTLTSNGLTDGNAKSICVLFDDAAATENGLTFDDPTVENLSFVYVGPPEVYTGSATAVLTVDTSLIGGDTTSVYSSVDRSGTDPGSTYGTAQGTIFVPGAGSPAAVPLPNCLSAGVALFGLLVVGRTVKSARARA